MQQQRYHHHLHLRHAHNASSMADHDHGTMTYRNPSLQSPYGPGTTSCTSMKLRHVSVLVKRWRWLPDNLHNLYSCVGYSSCGLTCLWTKSPALADAPDALLFETTNPPPQVYALLYANLRWCPSFIRCLHTRPLVLLEFCLLFSVLSHDGLNMIYNCSWTYIIIEDKRGALESLHGPRTWTEV